MRDDVPHEEQIETPLLLLIYLNGGDYHAIRSKHAYSPLGDFFALFPRAREVTLRELGAQTDEPALNNRVRWARERLHKLGYLADSKQGVWKLNDAGVRAAEQELARMSEPQKERLSFPDRISPVDTSDYDWFADLE